MIDLFTFSHAGGNSTFIAPLRNYLNKEINLKLFDYKGRGGRFNEALYDNLKDALDDAASYIINNRNSEEFAILGYSFGSTVCYYLYQFLNKMYCIQPKHIFFMSNVAPYVPDDDKELGMLPDDQFWSKIKEYGGIPEEFFEHQDLIDLYLPILRSDVNCEKLYKNDRILNIDCGMSVLYSPDDKHVDNNVERWKDCSKNDIKFYKYCGGHFFLKNNYEKVADVINKRLIVESNCV